MKTLLNYSLLYTSIVFLFTSCFKEDIHTPQQTDVISTIDDLRAEVYLKERDALLCQQYSSNGDSTKVEFTISSNIVASRNYMKPNISYWAKAPYQIYSAKKVPGLNKINIYNVLDGNVLLTFNYTYFINDGCVANGKLFVSEQLITAGRLNVYHAETNVLIDDATIGTQIENLAVSYDGSHIFLGSESSPYCYSKKIIGNVLNDISLEDISPQHFTPDTYSLSEDGKFFIGIDGRMFNDQLDLIHDFSISWRQFKNYYITPDAKVVICLSDRSITTYDALSFNEISTVDLMLDVSWKYLSGFPYMEDNELRFAVNCSNGIAKKLMLLKL